MPATTTSSPFSFLANLKPNTSSTAPTNSNPILTKTSSSNDSPAIPENGLGTISKSPSQQSTSKVDTKDKSETPDEKSPEYYAKLKGLNEGVTQWIKKHVDTNPFCILTPIFRDYEKYLQQIESKHGQEVKKESSKEETIAEKSSFENIKETPVTSEKKVENSIFGNASAGTSSAWKPEKSIFGNTSNTKSIFGGETKTESRTLFGGVAQDKNPFLNKSSSEENQLDKSKTDSKPTSSGSFPSATFSFGQSSSTSAASAGFSFGRSVFVNYEYFNFMFN